MPTMPRRPRRTTQLLAALVAALPLVAASPAQAAASDRLGYDDARLLLTRTGFGATDAEIRAYAPLTRDQAVDKLLATTRTTPVTPVPPALLDTTPIQRPGKDATPEERKAFVKTQLTEGLALRGWWIEEMLATPSPLTERMTLFWHNHFVSSQQKVRVARLMYRQNATFRANALGNFGTLLHAASKDAAMVVYLDSVQNRKGTPNENFAREVMELFTLGEGHYSEQDVKEAARAFTGWSLERGTGDFTFRPRLHDDGIKVVLGTRGNLDGDQVLDILLAQPSTATFVTTKLWREFVSPDPDAADVARIAAHFRASRYDIKVALRDLLTDDAFYAKANRATLTKSPVDIVVGTLHTLGIDPAQPAPFAVIAAGMGQNLFAPPNVKGWPGGEDWINTNSLLARKQFLLRIAQADKAPLVPSTAPMMMGGTDGDGGNAMVAVPARGFDATATDAMAATTATGRAAQRTPALKPQQMLQQRAQQYADRGVRDIRFDPDEWLAGVAGTRGDSQQAAAIRVLLPRPPVATPAMTADAQTLVRTALLDPTYQLK
ncbi:MAG: DUF1800 domain-containing protein [Proteobacteria bacterium]|nr:DUF1800 domain-containing protein [Pseudomonadota bacterium]